MSGLVLTRRGRLVRSLVLLLIVVAAVAAAVWLLTATGHHAPITDAQWRDALADARWRMAHGR